jgi:SAM-dependent methyltransferase
MGSMPLSINPSGDSLAMTPYDDSHAVVTGSCLACGSREIRTILNLGEQVAANLLYVSQPEAPRLGLELAACRDCGHGQLTHQYSPTALFTDYLYASGTSQSLRSYFSGLGALLSQIPEVGNSLLELASNDGSFLLEAEKLGFTTVGIDPSSRMTKRARESGLVVHNSFWPNPLLEVHGQKLIVAQNVLAHVPDPLAFLEAVANCLVSDGLALIQTSQLWMVPNGEFDTVYHEHFSYFSYNSLKQLSKRAGLSISQPYQASVHGGSLVAFVSPSERRLHSLHNQLQSLLDLPDTVLTPLPHPPEPKEVEWLHFAVIAKERLEAFSAIHASYLQRGYKMVLVGAAAKANTFLTASQCKIDMIVDEAMDKVGLYVPNLDIQVDSLTSIATIEEPCMFILGAWNFREELIRKIKALRKDVRDIAVTYFPALELTEFRTSVN